MCRVWSLGVGFGIRYEALGVKSTGIGIGLKV